MTELTITQARRSLLDLPARLSRLPERAVSVTRRGRPVLAVLPWDLYESIVETLDVASDPELMSALRASIEDLKHGRLVSHAEARERLGVSEYGSLPLRKVVRITPKEGSKTSVLLTLDCGHPRS